MEANLKHLRSADPAAQSIVLTSNFVALYFLKLRRQPLEVPSTYLWKRSIEDLHVNSLWQRLRQNLLMFLQLLLIALAMLALLRPGWEGTKLDGDRFIFLVDNSEPPCGIEPQHFVTRSDLACGSTIGPLAAASVGIRAVDLGNPMLSMHSCRELAGAADVAPMIALLGAFFASPLALDAR